MDIHCDHYLFSSGALIFTRPRRDSEKMRRPLIDSDQLEETAELPHVLCGNCRFQITLLQERIEVAAAHRHTFANPNGYLFEIGCFRRASGCVTTGGKTIEFTWFKGYFWQIAICRNCLTHLGWRFQSANDLFYGLILDRLTES